MQPLESLFNNQMTVYSSIVISDDLTSKLINIHKDAELQDFYKEIELQFPNIENYKLFYFEGYSNIKYYVSNNEEYIIAKKKGIEYFYFCSNNSDDNLDYLRYYSVMLFCPIKRLNKNFQINQRKNIQLEKIEPIKKLHRDVSQPNFNYNFNAIVQNINENNNNYNFFDDNNINLNQNINNLNNQMHNLQQNNNNNQNNPLINYMNFQNNNINIGINHNLNIPRLQKKLSEYEPIDTESDPVNRYIENAINYSVYMKYIISFHKQMHPEYFINIDETLASPGLLYQNYPNPIDHKYIICLLGKILKNKNIHVGIYNQGYNIDRINLSAVQFIFSGLINKKKYRLKFSPDINYSNIMENLASKKLFIEEWKVKIANILQMNKSLIILTNPRNNDQSLYLDLAFNPKVVEINDKKLINTLVKGDIIKCTPVPLLGGCILSPCIFCPQFSKYYNLFSPIQKRGGEEYMHPFQWTAYGINVFGKYDFGNNNWLGNTNNIGEFAVAYHGINNITQENIKDTDSFMGNSETGKTFIKVKNMRNPNHYCKPGIYFYKNPIYAENASELINIGGFEYKIMFMCRVNTAKINQPENFKDCWILSPTPDEVRPYKILIKKIPKSPLSIASEGEIKICIGSPPQFYLDIIKERDESYLNNINNINGNFLIDNQNKLDFLLREWTGAGASRINNYLRNHIVPIPEPILKSNVWCLHKAITKSINNVPNNTIVYRGIKAKIPFNMGIGTKFYFQEFLSTSKNIDVAKGFALFGTLLIISIQNNGTNGKKVYCRDIEYLSDFPFEKEIIFTAFCQFKVAKIEKQNNLDIIYLTCDGYNF